MRVDSIKNIGIHSKNTQRIYNNNQGVSHSQKTNYVMLSFTGKNINQVASITHENTALGLPEMAQGGEGVVGNELVASLRNHEKVDARSFMPFWSYNNPKGGYKFLIHKESEYPVGQALPDTMPAKNFYSANYGETLEDVAKRLKLKTSELSYVIQSAPNGASPDSQSKYIILEPTSIKGSLERPSETSLLETRKIDYALLKVSENNPSYNKLKGEPHYFVYTKAHAQTAKPYSYDCHGNGSFDAEILNSDEMRALSKIITKEMDTEEFGNYNPANVLCHDRPAHTFANHIANSSAAGDKTVNGLKIHIIEHNPGRNYQGITSDPFKMIPIVCDETDVALFNNSSVKDTLLKAQQHGIYNDKALNTREQQIVWATLEPMLRPFRDGAGTYNIIKTGIAAAKANPENISVGTVSLTFDKEMKSQETPDAAKFLTDDFASIETKSVVNGVTPANLKLDDATAPFGRGDNGLTKAAPKGFTPFKYNGNNIEEIIDAKNKNAKWLTKLIAQADKKGLEELKKLFFNEAQIRSGQTILGHLSPIKDGEILIFGFGRPDEQKGFNISVKGFLEFFKRSDIDVETKKKVKGLFGAGKWDENASDYKEVVQTLKEIAELDGGIYKNNIMYIDGYTPNRLVGCSHFSLFTSRREMCGITPIESKIAGTPYGITKTGGPVDYTNELNGYMTKEAVELRPEHYGLTWNNSAQEIDAARVQKQSAQVGDMIYEMINDYANHKDVYIAKSKKNIEELVDWHNNSEYNNGKSANKIYLENIFETDKPLEARNNKPMKRSVQTIGEYIDYAEEILNTKAKSRPMKAILAVFGGIAVLAGGYFIYMNRKQQNKIQHQEKTLNKVA